MFIWLCGSAPLISDAYAGVTLSYYLETGKNPSSHPVTAASPVATPIPKLSPAIYATLPSLNTVAVYPIASNGNVPSLVGNASVSNPGGIGYWGGRLYVTNVGTDSITVYPASANGSTSPIVTIQGEKPRLSNPTSIAFDSAGNIYVANAGKSGSGRDSVTKYAAGSSGDVAPVAEITGDATKLSSPSGLTVDSSGNIYVANEGSKDGGPDSITVYSPGSTGNAAPAKVISGSSTLLDRPGGVAVDSKGNIYATSFGAEGNSSVSILVYSKDSAGNVAPSESIDGDCAVLSCPGAIALDASANIYVTNPGNIASGDESVAVFTHDTFVPGYTGQCLTPAYNIFGPKTGIAQPFGIAVDSVGGIYVTNSEADSILVFQTGDNGNVTPTATIATTNNILAPTSVALDASGKIYVVNGNADRQVSNTVTIYAPGSNAATAPIATIGSGTDDKTEISSPFAVAVDKEGKVYVANQADGTNFSITVYAAGSTGDVAPIAKISRTKTGDKTGLNFPNGLALDAANKLYVLNEFGDTGQGGSIAIYSPGANGNVAPEAKISDSPTGKHTQLNSPEGLALDTAGNMYVTNDGGSGSVTIYAAGSKGDVAPKAIISGSNTGLATPRGIAIDSKENIYVANASDGVVTDEGADDSSGDHNAPATITVYPPGSNGNVKPIATITGPLTSLEHPEGIAIGPANLTPPPPQSLAAYDWSMAASPNLVDKPPSKEVVERFMLAVQTTATSTSSFFAGGPGRLSSYKFADLRHDGFLSLVAATDMGGKVSCSDSHNGGLCSVYIVDKTKTGFEVYKSLGSIDAGGIVPLGIQDLGHDGNLEVVISQPFTSIFKLMPGRPILSGEHKCIASWPTVYAWTGDGYKNVSDRFKDFYRNQLDALNKTISELPGTGASYDQRDKECLQAEAAKTERLLGGSPNAGLESAFAFANGKDPAMIPFGIFIVADIDTPEAKQDLDTLLKSQNPGASRQTKQWLDARSKGMDKFLKQFERLR
jgi:sugar lactone lactonase YvrE